jgi:hypothetical protein
VACACEITEQAADRLAVGEERADMLAIGQTLGGPRSIIR